MTKTLCAWTVWTMGALLLAACPKTGSAVAVATSAVAGATTVVVETQVPCWTALLSEADVRKAGRNGWWDAWHAVKKARGYQTTPATFRDLPNGTYVLVVFNPAANVDKDKVDGLVLERLTLSGGVKALRYNKSDFKDWNCLSCPWLYASDGRGGHVRVEEILKDVVGRAAARTTAHALPQSARSGDVVRVQLREEKDEITYLDALSLVVGGLTVPARVGGAVSAPLGGIDDQPIVLRKGDRLDVEFVLPAGVPAGAALELRAHGFYEPDVKMLDALLESFTPRK